MESVNFAWADDLIDSGTVGEGPEGIVNQFDELQAAYPNDAAAGWEGSVITFTIGGNDVLSVDGDSWAGILGGCILSFGRACHTAAGNQPANLDEIQAKATQFTPRWRRMHPRREFVLWATPSCCRLLAPAAQSPS